ncbi:putative NADP-dependent oxidoreductase YfmJ like protein [Verticillium longisporum]|uniref:Dehydrogenase FUB6 n=1 Tax=Verticillium longisporum TaxID=100787 RepID=A0A8I2ZP44_VERLO|nr:putative NADP-dependent oxidoreductase YfmJ like protein [Verticillium longisporum]KAG7148858.1 putative NADP-dependent oxidoreductase YfmJ like protein [Verticillium longisporum]
MSESLRVVLAERPKADIIPGQTFKTEKQPVPREEDLKDGEVLVENLYLSLDPAMRGWLNDKRSYLPPVQIGETMRGAAVSRILASKSDKAAAGDIIPTYAGWAEHAILPPAAIQPAAAYPPISHPTDYLSVLGTTGLTAYFGMLRIGEPKAGETVVVSGAAGATGSVAGQLAKIRGARVIGIAGSDDKCKWLTDDLGFDVAINYKDPDFRKKFKEATPNFVDVYFDNVGGAVLEAALDRAKEHARFVICGAISQYNTSTPAGPRNYTQIITMRIKMQGFIVLDFAKEFPQARKELAQWLDEGKIKRKDTIVQGGLKVAEQALVDLYNGINTGKMIVEIKNPAQAKL